MKKSQARALGLEVVPPPPVVVVPTVTEAQLSSVHRQLDMVCGMTSYGEVAGALISGGLMLGRARRAPHPVGAPSYHRRGS